MRIKFEVRVHSPSPKIRQRVKNIASVILDEVLAKYKIFGYNIDWGVEEHAKGKPFSRITGIIYTSETLDEEKAETGKIVKEIIATVRRVKAANRISLKAEIPLLEIVSTKEKLEKISSEIQLIKDVMHIKEVKLIEKPREGVEYTPLEDVEDVKIWIKLTG